MRIPVPEDVVPLSLAADENGYIYTAGYKSAEIIVMDPGYVFAKNKTWATAIT